VIVTLVEAATLLVVTVKLADVLPALTVTDAGTMAAALLLESVTTVPPAGAAVVRVTVPVDEEPAITLPGFVETLARARPGEIVRVEVSVPPP
jgi:hypothetical protein